MFYEISVSLGLLILLVICVLLWKIYKGERPEISQEILGMRTTLDSILSRLTPTKMGEITEENLQLKLKSFFGANIKDGLHGEDLYLDLGKTKIPIDIEESDSPTWSQMKKYVTDHQSFMGLIFANIQQPKVRVNMYAFPYNHSFSVLYAIQLICSEIPDVNAKTVIEQLKTLSDNLNQMIQTTKRHHTQLLNLKEMVDKQIEGIEIIRPSLDEST